MLTVLILFYLIVGILVWCGSTSYYVELVGHQNIGICLVAGFIIALVWPAKLMYDVWNRRTQ